MGPVQPRLFGQAGVRVNAIAPGLMETPASRAAIPPLNTGEDGALYWSYSGQRVYGHQAEAKPSADWRALTVQ